MAYFPSRNYVTPRTRMIRRLYFAAAVVVILLIVIITLYSLSERTEQQDALETVAQEPEPKPAVQQPPRMVEPLPPPEPIVPPEPEPEDEPMATEPEQLPEIIAEPNSIVAEMIAEALALLNERPPKVIEARDRLNELLPMEMTTRQQALVKEQLAALADVWLFSRTVYPGDTLCAIYKVQVGDRLSDIGKAHKVPWEIIQQLNGISRPEELQAGQAIKVIKGPFHARIYLSSFTMDLFLQDTYVRSFPVGLGKPGHETPTGLWVVKPGGKLIKPIWTDQETGRTYEPSDPDYPLGSRWIALEGLSGAAEGRKGFAIHGTKDANEIGVAKSRGCIRLHNGNAILLYNLVMPGESRVEVVD
jgi:LysM repeat protein